MAHVDDGAAPPVELRLNWMALDYHVPPDVGGMLDQDALLINQMRTSHHVYLTLSHLRNAKGAEIHALSDAERRTLRWLMDEGLING